jgi:uncharacterized surface protein with fasciclin (FAS1) repeats
MDKNVHSLDDFTDSVQEALFRNHIVESHIETDDIGLGTLFETNALGDYLVTEFEGSDIIVSKYSKIINRNIRTANGVIHVMDKVLDPVTADIFNVITSDPSYGIFSEGLRLTGLKDTLQLISFPYGQREARTRFTVLAVADTIFQRYGIASVEDLIAWCGSDSDSLTYLTNPFYRYMEYHCLNGSYYLSDLNTGIYPILSRDNNLAFTIDTDYKINYNPRTGIYTGFIIPASNTPAKNGALHAINDLLPVSEPEPASVRFETTDFFDLKQSDYYLTHYERFFDGENTFEKIKWKGDYLLYYYNKMSEVNNHQCLSMQGWWTISITFPKVMKGRYEVKVHEPAWQLSICEVHLDGLLQPYIYADESGATGGGLQKIADADFKTTAEHTITLRNLTVGMLFWDYVQFDPVTH